MSLKSKLGWGLALVGVTLFGLQAFGNDGLLLREVEPLLPIVRIWWLLVLVGAGLVASERGAIARRIILGRNDDGDERRGPAGRCLVGIDARSRRRGETGRERLGRANETRGLNRPYSPFLVDRYDRLGQPDCAVMTSSARTAIVTGLRGQVRHVTADLQRCEEHGVFEGERCPPCDARGQVVLDGARRERLSRFVSGALRHFPGDAGVELDESGWTGFRELATAIREKYDWASDEHLDAVIEADPKGRFERDDDRVRAAYGHSVEVELEGEDAPVPDTLYHGTAPKHVESILEEGLRAMGRQAVHLSETVEDARAVGERHAEEAVIFEVDAAGLREDGYDIAKRGKATYTVETVPPAYLAVLEARQQ